MPGPQVSRKRTHMAKPRAGHVPPLPGGKGRTSSVRKATLIRRCGATFPPRGKA